VWIGFNPLAINQQEIKKDAVEIFPQPSKGIFSIRASDAIHQVQIIDVNGKTVKSIGVNGLKQVEVNPGLAAGVYFVLLNNDPLTRTKLIITE
jgi:hypothetical protein